MPFRLGPAPLGLLAAAALAVSSTAVGADPPAATPALAPAAAADPSAEVARLLGAVDAAWPSRDEPGKLDAILVDLKKAEALAPSDYDVLWRTARWYYWMADAPDIADEEKARLGKTAWDYGDRATASNPNRVEGWFYASTGVGMYSIGISIIKALLDGMEGKYLDRLKKAESIDPSYYGYGAEVAWGRYWYELPWPKYDAEKSEAALRKALKQYPKNLRAKVFLAELYLKEDHAKEATKLLEDVIAASPGAYDAPEERRVQAMARRVLAKAKS